MILSNVKTVVNREYLLSSGKPTCAMYNKYKPFGYMLTINFGGNQPF